MGELRRNHARVPVSDKEAALCCNVRGPSNKNHDDRPPSTFHEVTVGRSRINYDIEVMSEFRFYLHSIMITKGKLER